MFAGISSAHATLAATAPISPEIIAAVATAILLPPLILWLVMRNQLKQQEGEAAAALQKLRTDSEATLQAEHSRAAAQAAEHTRASATAAASLADLQQRFNTHREVAERRANDASQQIARLEADLISTREVAAQLPPTLSRIKDLEIALAAEQGRVQAQEQAITATNARAADFEKRMIDAQEMTLKHKAEMQQSMVELKKIRDEQAAYAAAGGAEAELTKAREATQQAEAKVANLQRALKAAEARVEMVQKEFMNAMGMATAPASGTPAGASDKKLRELEEKLAQSEAEARKRAREDGYKIAELEYRLSEALETARAAAPAPAAAAVEAPPATEPLSHAPVAEVTPKPVIATPAVEPPKPEPVAPNFTLPPPAAPAIESPIASPPSPATATESAV